MAQQIRSAQQKAALQGQAPAVWAIGARCQVRGCPLPFSTWLTTPIKMHRHEQMLADWTGDISLPLAGRLDSACRHRLTAHGGCSLLDSRPHDKCPAYPFVNFLFIFIYPMAACTMMDARDGHLLVIFQPAWIWHEPCCRCCWHRDAPSPSPLPFFRSSQRPSETWMWSWCTGAFWHLFPTLFRPATLPYLVSSAGGAARGM